MKAIANSVTKASNAGERASIHHQMRGSISMNEKIKSVREELFNTAIAAGIAPEVAKNEANEWATFVVKSVEKMKRVGGAETKKMA